MSNFYERYTDMCAKCGYTPSGAASAIGLSNAAANGWKKGKVPSDVNIAKLAALFGCSASELKGQSLFFTNFVDQCNKANLSPSAAAEAMGFQRSVVTRWSKGTEPRAATLQKIADFFGCSVDELKKEKPAALGNELFEKFSKLSAKDQALVRSTMLSMIEQLLNAQSEQ